MNLSIFNIFSLGQIKIFLQCCSLELLYILHRFGCKCKVLLKHAQQINQKDKSNIVRHAKRSGDRQIKKQSNKHKRLRCNRGPQHVGSKFYIQYV